MLMPGRSRIRFACLSAISIALALCGCETPKHASTEETLGAAGSYLVCLHNAAAALDDHVSDVSKIAPAVADRCAPQFESGLETITRGMPPLKAALFRHKAQRENLKLAAAAVHEERIEKQDSEHR